MSMKVHAVSFLVSKTTRQVLRSCPWQQLAKQHTAQKDSRPVPFRSHTVTAGSTSALPLAPPGRPSRSAATVVPPSHRDRPSTQQGRPRAERSDVAGSSRTRARTNPSEPSPAAVCLSLLPLVAAGWIPLLYLSTPPSRVPA